MSYVLNGTVTVCGKLFHNRGPAVVKVQSPTVLCYHHVSKLHNFFTFMTNMKLT